MDTYLINKIEKKLNQFRLTSAFDYKNAKKDLYVSHPSLFDLENKKRLIVSDFTLSKEEKEKATDKINKEINNYITKNNIIIPEKKYHCTKCNDTGYIGNQRCECFTKMLIDESLKNECVSNSKSFENFDENIFDNSIKKKILEIRDYLKIYSERFPCVKKPNTVLCGSTGTGKTFLLSCVYAELKKRGISVVFITAGKLFDILRKYALNQTNNIDVLLDAEMLIIDDLGSEPMFNNITVEYLFLLINERSQNNKSICVSTNLTADELKAHYNERISSRLFDLNSTYVFSIPGKDLRQRL